MDTAKLISGFFAVFKDTEPPVVVRSPGRVNIIGEHTDYNEGYVLPAAIDKAIYVAVSKRSDDRVHLYSVDFSENFETTLAELKPVDSWATYVLGVADQLIRRGHRIGGFNLALDGNVPIGAGLSSSAAVECATAFALNEIFGLGLERMEMVKLAQKAEHEFAGVMCGIMDQFASMFGKKDAVMRLDCRSLEFEYVPLQLQGYKIVLLNSNVKHSLTSSEYNTRRQQCEQGVAWVKQQYPDVKSLRDISSEMLEKWVKPKDELVFRRCKYVVDENKRLLGGCSDLEEGRLEDLGKKMFQTHDGLSRDYEVSCTELDVLVDAVRNNPSVPGARMMGGGFGGCSINLVKEDAIEELIEKVFVIYKKETGLDLSAYIAQVENGTGLVNQKEFRHV